MKTIINLICYHLVTGAILLGTMFLNSSIVLAQGDLYNSPIYRQWSDLFLKGEHQTLLTSVEQNILSTNPHPMSKNVWIEVHEVLGDIDSAFSVCSEPLKKQLARLIDIYKTDPLDLPKKYPVDEVQNFDDWSELYRIGVLLNYEVDPEYSLLIEDALFQRYPNAFVGYWGIEQILTNYTDIYKKYIDQLEKYKNPLFNNYLEKNIKVKPFSKYDALVAIDTFLVENPFDAIGIRYKAARHYDLEHYENAIDSYSVSFALDPISRNGFRSLMGIAKSYAVFQEKDSVKKIAEQLASLYKPNDAKAYKYVFWAIALRETGDHGQARKVLEEGINLFPEHQAINYQFGLLEKADEQYDESIPYLKKALLLDSNNSAVKEALIEAFKLSENLNPALEMAKELLASEKPLSASIYYEISDLYENYEEHKAAEEVNLKALDFYPYSSNNYAQLAYVQFKQGKKEESIHTLDRILSFSEPWTWVTNQYYSLYSETLGEDNAKKKLYELADKYPYEEGIWDKLAELEDGTEAKIKVWQKVSEYIKGWHYPYQNIRNLLLGEERWDDIEVLIQDASETISQYGRYKDKVELNFVKATCLIGKLRKNRISTDEWHHAKTYFDQYLHMGGYAGAYYEYVGELYLSINMKDSAAWYYSKQFRYRPDASPFNVVATYGKGKIGIKMMYDYTQRKPYREDGIKNLIHLHDKWGGSSIAAIKFAKDYKEKLGGIYDVSTSYSNLGAHAQECENYMNANSISESYRYIDWYNIARKNAWKGSSQVEIDYEKGIATVLLPNGTIVKRKDNLEYGVTELIQIGPVYISAEYDEKGQLTTLSNSAGKDVRLFYNELGQIDKMIDQTKDQKDELELEYNNISKPTLLLLNDKDTLRVSYNTYGEILSVMASSSSEDESPSKIAIKITSIFQSLLSMTEAFQSISSLGNLNLPNLGVPDKVFDQLESEYDSLHYVISYGELSKELLENYIAKTIAYTDYMYDNISADQDYAEKIFATIDQMFVLFSQKDDQRWQSLNLLHLVNTYYKALDKIRNFGVDIDTWERWINLLDWLEQEKLKQNELNAYRLEIEKLQRNIQENPIELIADANWLPKSFLQNNGFWKKFTLDEIISSDLIDGVKLQSVYQLQTGEVLVGTNKGIASMQTGYWQWMGFDDFNNQFDRELSQSKINGSSDISCFTETADSTLYIATKSGLLIGSNLHEGKWEKITTNKGLSSNVITSLLPLGDFVLVGTSNGLSAYSQDSIWTIPEFDNLEIKDLQGGVYNIYDSDYYIIGAKTNQGVFFCFSDSPELLSFRKVDGSLFSHVYITHDAEAYILKDKDLFRIAFEDSSFNLLKQYGTIPLDVSDKIYGLTEVSVNREERGLTVMTDRGLAFFHKKHFEQFHLPFSDQKAPVKSFSNNIQNSFQLISSDGVYLFQNENYQKSNSPIHELLTVNELGMTFIADGDVLKYINHKNGKEVIIDEYSSYATTTQLAVDLQMRLICNDGNQILRYTFNPITHEMTNREELFLCDDYVPEDDNFGTRPLTEILCASDSTIWVSKGRAVFRYRDDGRGVQEYNFFRSEKLFPSRTYNVDNIVETVDHRILVIGSDEGHLKYRGIEMEGGLLEWDASEEKFIRLTNPKDFNWFVTSYTPLDDGKAVFGTLSGFGEDKKGVMRNYKFYGDANKNLSYDRVYEEHKNLFEGTRGAKLDDGLWLFGCAAGVLAYQDGMWFYPDRFNQMLPDDLELNKYGSRHINAIETDPHGKIYVGTDRGLMIYDPKGADPMSFLIHNLSPSNAFLHKNINILQDERDAILSNIPEDSESGELIKDFEQSQAKIDQIDNLIGKSSQNILRAGPGGSPEKRVVDSLTIIKETLIAKHSDKLINLQQKDPHLHQLLTLPPLDLVASRRHIKDDEAIIQYIPATRSLFIQILAKDKVIMQEVDIPKKILMDSCISINKQLSESIIYSDPEQDEKLIESLAFLYDVLLRPIQNELRGFNSIYVVPSEALYYIPFSALVRKKSTETYSFAVEDFNIGYVTSMYLFNLIYNAKPSTAEEVLLMGDPDGKLVFARAEVEKIKNLSLMNCTPFIGHKANTENFKAKAKGAKIIHLATHGELNKKSIKDSWIQFFDKKMSMADIFALSLHNTDMVTLSACETAKGGENGMEYVTLARAFTAAGTPTVVATLWRVEDESTKELMYKFYQHYESSRNKFTALAEAQREMLKSDDFKMSQIARWSSFIPIGKP